MITSPPPAGLLEPADDAPRRKRAVLYIRVSTIKQAQKDALDPDGYSLPAQREVGESKADELGADVVEVFVDRGESAKTADRKGFQDMLAYIEAHRDVDYVILDKVDRFARNRREDANILFQLRRAGARLVSVKENIDDTPAGQLLHGILATLAEYYSNNLAAEALKGMTQKAKTGGTNGRAPIGYLNERRRTEDGPEVAIVEVDPDRAPLVQWAFEAYASGEYTLRQLTEALQARGLRSPFRGKKALPVTMSLVGHMLSNTYYLGYVTFQGITYRGKHQPLITQATFDRVQAIFAERYRAGEKQRVHRHYLKGSLFCGLCGDRMSFTRATGRRGGTYDYFYCLGRQTKRTECAQPWIPADLVERAIEDFWQGFRLPKPIAAQVRTDLDALIAEQQAAAGPAIATAKRRLAALNAERVGLVRGVIQGSIPGDLARDEHLRIDREREEAQRIAQAAETVAQHIEGNLEGALRLLGRCDKVYRRSGPQDRRLANQFFFDKLLVDGQGVRAEITAEVREPWATLHRAAQEDPPSLVAAGFRDQDMVAVPGFEPGTYRV